MIKPDNQYTEFAPAERASDDTIQHQHELIKNLQHITEFMDAIPNASMILNKERQIIHANQAFLSLISESKLQNLLGKKQGEALGCQHADCIGKRTGEALNCIHSAKTQNGCGTSTFCRNCGAILAILKSKETNMLSIEECRMICETNLGHGSLDLRIWARPMAIAGETFTILSVEDISNEKRRRLLERIFFHDVLNTIGGIQGLTQMLAADANLPEEERNHMIKLLCGASKDLIEEIYAQRTLSQAETGDLDLKIVPLNALKQIADICQLYENHNVAKNKTTTIANEAEDFTFNCDRQLLNRILINLTKNALEASRRGDCITLSCRKTETDAEFTVHNPGEIPENVQLQIFNRSFSTKGSDRGIGTYSIKLLAERYLKGKATFISSATAGTTFKITLPCDD